MENQRSPQPSPRQAGSQRAALLTMAWAQIAQRRPRQRAAQGRTATAIRRLEGGAGQWRVSGGGGAVMRVGALTDRGAPSFEIAARQAAAQRHLPGEQTLPEAVGRRRRRRLRLLSPRGDCLCEPGALQVQMLHELHATLLGGHLGRDKTLALMHHLVWWPCPPAVQEYVSIC